MHLRTAFPLPTRISQDAKIDTFIRDDAGATAIEYGLIVALLAIVILSALAFLDDPVDGLFGGVAEHFESINSGEDLIEHYE